MAGTAKSAYAYARGVRSPLSVAIPVVFALLAKPAHAIDRVSSDQAEASVSAEGKENAGGLGNGIKVGNARLHPSAQAELHWINNPGYKPAGETISDMQFLGRLGYELTSLSDKLELSTSGNLERRQFLGIEDTQSSNLSAWAGRFGGTAIVNKRGALVLRLHEDLTRYADAGNQTVNRRLLHVYNDIGLGVDYKPGGGALLIATTYSFMYDRYDRDDNAALEPAVLDNYRHNPALRLMWKFLPKTGIFLEGDSSFTRYPYSSPSGTISNAPTDIVAAQAGLVGSVTPKMSALIKGGYTATLSGGSTQTWAGQVELTFALSEHHKIKAGVMRNLAPTAVFRFFSLLRGYASYEQLLLGKTELSLGAEYSIIAFGTPFNSTAPARVDQNIVANFGITHHFNEWLDAALLESLNIRTSNDTTISGNAGYVYNNIGARVSIRY